MTISVIGDRGLVINESNGDFSYVKEDQWRALPRFAVPTTGPVATLARLGATFSKIGSSVFVDLDRVAQLPETPGSVAAALADGSQQQLPAFSGTNIVLKEFNTVRVIPKTDWQLSNVLISGDAMVAIERGVPLTSIPAGNIPCGTFCVLINVTAMP